MKVKKILVPTDFSTTGDKALSYAAALARDTGATLLIVHVKEPPLAYGGGEMYYGAPDPNQRDLEEMLASVVAGGDNDKQVPYEHRLITGDPSTALVRLADDEDVDLIVMGTHGRTGLTRLLMGSVAEAVMRRASCPVLTVKSEAKAPSESAPV